VSVTGSIIDFTALYPVCDSRLGSLRHRKFRELSEEEFHKPVVLKVLPGWIQSTLRIFAL